MKKYILFGIMWLVCVGAYCSEKRWRTHFAYNSVQIIAMDDEQVYAVANNKLFSINQTSEHLTLYNNFSGLHGTEIAQLAYDTARSQLLILYIDGKIDIWHSDKRIQYISDLYNKQMTASKKCNNITIHKNIAYLSMDFGILTFDLDLYEIVDTYYIGPEAKEVIVSDVMINGDSIYAKTSNAVYAAHLEDNIVDFRFWTSYPSSPIAFDTKKGLEYTNDKGDTWKVAGTRGVERTFVSGEKTYYLPDGPYVNIPYYMLADQGKLYMVPGGRWINQNKTSGCVMIYNGEKWKTIYNSTLQSQTQKPVLDLTSVAVDPRDKSHYFITSYGTGLYEFSNDTLINHYTPSNSIIGSAAPNNPDRYTRVDAPVFDADGVLWVAVSGGVDTTLVAIQPDGTQRGLNLNTTPDTRFILNTPGNILIDVNNPNRKWITSCRSEPSRIVLDDGGSKFDAGDDKCVARLDFRDQDGGVIAPEFFYTIAQAPNGDMWIGSSAGPIIIPKDNDFLENNNCHRLRIKMQDESNFLDTERVNAFAWDGEDRLWIGTQTGGLYVLDSTYQELVACYTSDNSVMPSNTVIALAYDEVHDQMFIGTGSGLVSYLLGDDVLSSNTLDEEMVESDGSMYQWRAHNAFTYVKHTACMGDKVYGLSANALFSVDKLTGLVKNYTKADGLSAAGISHIAYNSQLNRLLITYDNGQIDIMTEEEEIYNISDLYLKQMNTSKAVNDVCIYQDKAYLAMTFGIIVINMRKAEIEDTYYIGYESSEVNVQYICVVNNQVYAISTGVLYHAYLKDNLVDYAYWQTIALPTSRTINGMRTLDRKLYVLLDKQLYMLNEEEWKQIDIRKLSGMYKYGEELFVFPNTLMGVGKLNKNGPVEWIAQDGTYHCVAGDGAYYWLGSEDEGLVRYTKSNKEKSSFYPEGPANNFAYKIRIYGDKLYMLPGGRWSNEYKRSGDIMIFENEEWTNIKNSRMLKMTDGHKILDLMNVAQDPLDEAHFFVTSFGTGLYELYGDSIINIYLPSNSNLMSAAPAVPDLYTRTDGITYDKDGNLWLLNMGGGGTKNIHVIDTKGKWHSYNAVYKGKNVEMHTAGDILIDKRNPEWKWIPLMRYNTGLVLIQDNGTPTDPKDDIITYRTDWIDQYGLRVLPSTIHSIAQDQNNTIWVGTGSGVFVILPSTDFTASNQCKRVTISRNDGTQLSDFLFDGEQINDIKIDGANRLWVATATSGVFLLQPVDDIESPYYTVETVHHFTTENSILPSNEVLSIGILESTGEIFFGTGAGLVSYMSDATLPEEDLKEIYVYPNPVRPEYAGYITFKGLMENTQLRIVDGSGNLVTILTSNGGTATWDGKNSTGQRVSTGVYTAICNTPDGAQHGTVKVMVIN